MSTCMKWVCMVLLGANLFYLKWLLTLHFLHEEEACFINCENQNLKNVDDLVSEQSNYTLPSLLLEVYSSSNSVKLSINSEIVHIHDGAVSGRGLHMLMVHPVTGKVFEKHIFDSFSTGDNLYLNDVLREQKKCEDDYIIVFAVKDEASYKLSKTSRKLITELGSKHIFNLKWRSLWAMISWNRGLLIDEIMMHTENISSWPDPVQSRSLIPLNVNVKESNCNWSLLTENKHRSEFCSKYLGYTDVCKCSSNTVYKQLEAQVTFRTVSFVPVLVIAGNRPKYLFRMLQSLVSAEGFNKDMVVIIIDGFFEETMDVVKLFGLQGIYHMPSGVGSARISQAYLSGFNVIFSLFSSAKYCIVFEEDLDISPDVFRYFSDTVQLLDIDDSLYCISAWNDQGYIHSSEDASLLYRVETMPGLGWLLKQTLFEDELKWQWPGPDKLWDWDMWIRSPEIRKGRECIIPDVSRTFHFGKSGININKHFYDLYFANRKFNQDGTARLQNVYDLQKDKYENMLHKLVRNARIIDGKEFPCNDSFVPRNVSKQHVVYFRSEESGTFLEIAKCLHIWDLDVRGLHKNAFRTFIKSTPVIFVSYPDSPYSIYKPESIVPISFGQ